MQVLCGKCGKSIDVGEATAGALVACPHCQAKVKVPQLDPGDSLAGLQQDEIGFAELSRRKLSGKIEIGCDHCRRVFIVGTEFAGQRAKCPGCGGIVQVPMFDESAGAETGETGETDAPDEVQGKSVFASELELVGADVQQADDAAEQAPVQPYLPSEPAGDAPLTVDAPPPAAEVLSAVSAPGAARRPRKQSTTFAKLAKYNIVAAIVFGAVGMVVTYVIMTKRAETNKPQANRTLVQEHSPVPSDGPPPERPPETIRPTSPSATSVRARVVDVSVDVFLGDGYLAAAPTVEYWKFRMEITADNGDLILDRGNRQATLSAGDIDGRLVAIRHPRSGLVPDMVTVVIPAAIQRTVTFVFEMPAGSSRDVMSARLKIIDVGTYLPDIPGSGRESPASIGGAYVEVPPRNLKPLLRDPVMAAIQGKPRQQIVIAGDDAGQLTVSLPTASVTGSGVLEGDGTYRLELTDGLHTLDCRLRVIDRDRLLLYLADEPFHQMTFARGAAARELPPPPAGLAQIADTPGFELPDGSEVRPRPIPPPRVQLPGEGGESSIFDP